jgi:hypothetical protein
MIRFFSAAVAVSLFACSSPQKSVASSHLEMGSPTEEKPAIHFFSNQTIAAEELGFKKLLIRAALPPGYRLYYKITEQSPAGKKETYLSYYNTAENCASLPLLYVDDAIWHDDKPTFFKISFPGTSFKAKLRGEGIVTVPGISGKNHDGESFESYHFKEGADEYFWRIDFWVMNQEQAFKFFGVRLGVFETGYAGCEPFTPNFKDK